MKKNLYYFVICLLAFSSCSTANSKLMGTWQAVSLKNTRMEKDIANARIDIDTFGKNDPGLAKVVNLDSFKSVRKQLLEIDLKEQAAALQKLNYTFAKNNVVKIKTEESEVEAKWFFNEEGQLVIDERDLTGVGDPLYYSIVKNDDKELILQNVLVGDTSEMILKKK